MKTKDVDHLASIVKTLCRELEEPWAIGRFHYLMMGLIELAREGKPWKAVDVAFETSAFLCEMAERAEKEQKRAQAGTPIGIGTVAPAWNLGVERMRIHSDGYVQIRPEAPKPVATVEQMRAAADAAMAADPELVEWTCDTCHKKTLTDPDTGEILPIGWSTSTNLNTGEAVYTCNECQIFGLKHDAHVHDGAFTCSGCSLRSWTVDGKGPLGWFYNVEVDDKVYKALCVSCFGTGIPKQYQCMGCDSETRSRVFPPPGWKEVEDGEVICFACAEEEAKP